MDFTKYQQAVKFLESLFNLPIRDYLGQTKGRSFYLKRLNWLLEKLNHPEKSYKIIHIAGTAGKGTTTHLLHQMLLAAGFKVGSYYSPHTTTTIERIKVNQKYIAPAELVDLTDQIKPYLNQAALVSPYGQPSYFETLLAMAFLYFKKQRCRYVILEAGLGGKHDATNIVKHPLVCAITNIGYDHQEILGRTLTKIALDKAGIIKKGAVFFTTENNKKINGLLAQKCQKLNVPFKAVLPQKLPDENLAISIANYLKIQEKFIKQGLAQLRLPARVEILQTKPLVIVDGSHNPAKLKFLREKIQALYPKKCWVIFGLAQDKACKNSLKEIIPLAKNLLFTRFLLPSRKSTDLKILQDTAKQLDSSKQIKISTHTDPWQALNTALKKIKPTDCLIITGSFFLAGELRTHWISEEQILKKRNSV
ncbi:MAG: cyanophycin synthetase [Patescibacteria group bacterium]|jgi:dihydrofolate synthase/folylpolyglutamate synthase